MVGLNLCSNSINTTATGTTARSIENEVREIRHTLKSFLERLEKNENYVNEQDVVCNNYQVTIGRLAHEADSILPASMLQRPPSPSFVVSSISSGDKSSTYVTVQSTQLAMTLPSGASETADMTSQSNSLRRVLPSDVSGSIYEAATSVVIDSDHQRPRITTLAVRSAASCISIGQLAAVSIEHQLKNEDQNIQIVISQLGSIKLAVDRIKMWLDEQQSDTLAADKVIPHLVQSLDCCESLLMPISEKLGEVDAAPVTASWKERFKRVWNEVEAKYFQEMLTDHIHALELLLQVLQW